MLLTKRSWEAGRKYIVPFAATGAGLALTAGISQINHLEAAPALWWTAGGVLLLGALITLAFRDIARPFDNHPNIVCAPVSGTVKFAGDGLVAIFMWLVTRHTVLCPAKGTLMAAEAEGTKKRAAMWASASENYKWVLTFDNGLVVKMISGLIARRVLVWVAIDSLVRAGQRLGFICLASRVDVELPSVEPDVGSWLILVNKGQIVRQGQPIAVWIPSQCRHEPSGDTRLHSAMRVI
jgi:phosphatidylserine decarboxylase